MLQEYFDYLHMCLDANGQIIPGSENEINQSIETAEELCDLLLGSVLTTVKGRKFLLLGLEIYYAGIGDHAQDWYKVKYGNGGGGVNHAYVDIQASQGLKVYFQQQVSPQNNRVRMDIVVGNDGVPASFLIRDICDLANNTLIINRPNVALHAMGIQTHHLGEGISVNGGRGEFDLQLRKSEKVNIVSQLRNPRVVGLFDQQRQLKWYRRIIFEDNKDFFSKHNVIAPFINKS
ncbi:hypothetical protein [Leadbetterella byssophila]|uniref:hypothetical protein n=1 Tax=Leadbetterella byssophila TaxID=316068 RepID=UPI0039A2F28F